ncbi:MFS general substrate transporter [Yamadazyma tenuis ATCC 10573]|uniref:MFS general substrate transporter n=2 Tax=Candida tenuis TaxID=2315449 RepID=G3AXX9_CANTC|nr:MFS general substrate transporter [Yamadazyma tenuis ATCC 10573]EGV65719.1 MFS general substrate transporter [Yamadazyma tenuis ATCC 10573]
METMEIESGSFDDFDQYNVEYKGEVLYIESKDWRKSNSLKFQIVVVLCLFTLFGLGDQAVGALIPIFQKHYHVSDLQASFLFLSAITGYILMGLLNGIIHEKIGLRGILIIGTVSLCTGFGVFSTAPPFWVMVVFASFTGTGCGVLDAACNSWVGGLIDSNQILGILHGCYGLGCLISPSLISNLLERKINPWKWNQYYRLLFWLALVMFGVSSFVFRRETAKKYSYVFDLKVGKIGKDGYELSSANDELEEDDLDKFQNASLGDSLKSKLVWTFSLFLFLYVGGEVAFGSWLISYLLRVTKVSYKMSSHIATSFWTGLMVGRTVLGFATAYYFNTELTANLTYAVGSVMGFIVFYAISFTTWHWLFFVIAFVTGVCVGPIFPTTIVSAIGILPTKYHTSGVGFICAFGGGGAAVVPFLVGLVANSSKTGLKLFPLIILLDFLFLGTWWLLITKKFLPTYVRP